MRDCETSTGLYTLECNPQAPALPGRDGMTEGKGLASKIHLMLQSDDPALDVDAASAADPDNDPEDDPGLCR